MSNLIDGRKFGREKSSRKLMLNNLVKSLVEHETLNTTQAKAKEAKRVAERIITFGKKGTVHHRRMAYKYLRSRDLVKKVFDELAPRYKDINGGYTRVLKSGFRKGDYAPMAILQFVQVETKEPQKTEKSKKIKLKDLKTDEKK